MLLELKFVIWPSIDDTLPVSEPLKVVAVTLPTTLPVKLPITLPTKLEFREVVVNALFNVIP